MKKFLVLFTMIILLTGCEKDNQYDGPKIELTNNYTNSEFKITNSSVIHNMSNESYLIYTYLPYCMFKIPCDQVFKEVMDKYNLTVYSIPFDEFKKTEYYETVSFAPSILIIDKGKLVAYLDANSKKDYDRYQDSDEFEKWLGTYIYLKKE